jgi:preprotein translocase subunit SecY
MKRPTTCASTADFIPGIRPGRNTADYMNAILTKITVVGGIYLSILCLIPDIMISGIKLQHLPLLGKFRWTLTRPASCWKG